MKICLFSSFYSNNQIVGVNRNTRKYCGIKLKKRNALNVVSVIHISTFLSSVFR